MRKVLIVVDMQNDFYKGALPVKGFGEIIEPIRKYAANFDGEIYFTQDTHRKRNDGKIERKYLPRHCVQKTEGHQIVAELQELAEGNTVAIWDSFNKGRFLAQKYTEPMQVEFCGVCTDICVITSALYVRAKFPYATVIVHKDLCKGLTEEAHNAALTVMKNCLIEVK